MSKKTAGIEKMGLVEHYINQFVANKYYVQCNNTTS